MVAVEFGLLAPIIIGLVLVSLGFARIIEMNTLVYDAALESSRFGSTGACGSTNRLSKIVSVGSTILGVNPSVMSITTTLNGSGSMLLSGTGSITMTPYASWSALQSGTPNTSEPAVFGDAGSPGEVVVYTVSYSDPLSGMLLGLIPTFTRSATSHTALALAQTMVVQNEPNFGGC